MRVEDKTVERDAVPLITKVKITGGKQGATAKGLLVDHGDSEGLVVEEFDHGAGFEERCAQAFSAGFEADLVQLVRTEPVFGEGSGLCCLRGCLGRRGGGSRGQGEGQGSDTEGQFQLEHVHGCRVKDSSGMSILGLPRAGGPFGLELQAAELTEARVTVSTGHPFNGH